MKLSKEMSDALNALQLAIYEETEKKAKLGYNVIVNGKNGKPRKISAVDYLNKMKHFVKK